MPTDFQNALHSIAANFSPAHFGIVAGILFLAICYLASRKLNTLK